jgi:hypothetical protein
MKSRLLVLLSCLLAVFAVNACGPSGGGGGGGGGESLFDNFSENYNNGGGGPASDMQIIEEGLKISFSAFGFFIEYECECYTDTPQEAQQCVEEEGFSDADLEELIDCTMEVISDHPEQPPQGAVDYFACVGDAPDMGQCFDSVRNSHDDFCSFEAGEDLEMCYSNMDDHMRNCDTQYFDSAEGEVEAWFDAIDDDLTAAGCFENL